MNLKREIVTCQMAMTVIVLLTCLFKTDCLSARICESYSQMQVIWLHVAVTESLCDTEICIHLFNDTYIWQSTTN